MNLVLFITVLVISFIVVRIGAIAFQLTGLEWSLAKFQALSCFTSTGFTTKEAELITSNPQRRKIASVLIVLGHAGLVTLIATFANSLRPPPTKAPFVSDFIKPGYVPFINLVIIVTAVYIVYKIFTRTRFARRITTFLRRRLVRRGLIQTVDFEELAVATGGYGLSKISVSAESKLLDKTLNQSRLRQQDITVLAIESDDNITPNPPADTIIKLGDNLICFGRLDEIKKKVCQTKQTIP
ncbi:MAG: hypothetical protein JXB29_02220 [Sedimentisphaerales bacterium]|nr:hypothetical protein [Sedimentisphaerales bacterium]